MKNLILITNNFPFGDGETFIENEIEYLAKTFTKIYIISISSNSVQTRKVPSNCKIYRIKLKNFFSLIKGIEIFRDISYMKDLLKEVNIKNIVDILKFQYIAKIIEKEIEKITLFNKNLTIYSYWFYFGAYAGIKIRQKGKIKSVICRAHGYDLYEERNIQPFKKIILSEIDYVFPCSKQGEKYLCKKYREFQNKIKYSYLGVNKNKKSIIKEKKIKKDEVQEIVSCSNIIPLKQIDKIIEVLEILDKNKKLKIRWTHFGDGEDKNKIQVLAKKKLKNIKYEFKGKVLNEEIKDYYINRNISLFISLSSTEGLPVSIMEAQSAGIPVIATNVGGVSEIVSNKTGILIPKKFVIEEVASNIEKILTMSDKEIKKLRREAYKNWKNKFYAERNYKIFIERLKKL